ncbi:MAG: VWA domain-containing protein [bacterium]|nr:VWA domain-containing protein [bacterium]
MIERFAIPLALIALIVVPLIIYVRWRFRRVHHLSLLMSDTRLHKRHAGTGRARLRHLPLVLRILVIAILALALARPQSGTRMHEVTSEGVDIVLLIDISTSMKGEDFRPRNRLEEAKVQAAEFITKRENDRIGLVPFAGQAYTACPLTLDHDLLLEFMTQVRMGVVEDGTAIGSALATGANRLRESEAESKIMVLLTDGDNNAGSIDPLTAARAAASLGIKIYTIGVGKEGKVPYPYTDAIFGKRYQYVETNLDETTLREIAAASGGRFFRAQNSESLADIYREIDQLERTEISSVERIDYNEASTLFLLPAVLLLVCEFLLSHFVLRRLP